MKFLFSLLISCFSLSVASPQNIGVAKHKIAIFAPLYLDSAFDATETYRYPHNIFPKFINQGLEFYEGAQLALDSFAREGKQMDVYLYDTRSSAMTVEQQLNQPELSDVELMIVECSSSEVRLFAEAALRKNVPVINVNVPSGGGISNNPFFVVLNPTLKTQCEGIYRYIQRYYAIEPLVVFRKKGELENQIKDYFDSYAKSTMGVPLKMKYVDLPETFSIKQLLPYLDSNHHTLCLAASLDESFGKQLAAQLASVSKKYPLVIMGMPTWDAWKTDFAKPELKGPEIIYSTPFYTPRTDKTSVDIINRFNIAMYSRPSDMVFRGYEITWKFARLLFQYGKDISSNLPASKYNVFVEYNIQPEINKQTLHLDYFENKKLYFVKWQDGIIKAVN